MRSCDAIGPPRINACTPSCSGAGSCTPVATIRPFEPLIGEEEIREVTACLRSGWLTEHTRTRELERRFAQFVGAKFAAATTSGTVALFLAIAAQADNVLGKEVIVPSYTAVGTVAAVRLAGAVPVLADIDRTTGNLDVNDVRARMTDRTVGILPVHINGRPPSVPAIQEVAAAYEC